MRMSLMRTVSAVALVAAAAGGAVAQQEKAPTGSSMEQQRTQTQPQRSPDQGKQRTEENTRDSRSGRGAGGASAGANEPNASDRAREKSSPKSAVQGERNTPKASDRAQEKSSPNSAVRRGDSESKGPRTSEDKQRGEATKQRADDKGTKEKRTFGQGPDGQKGVGAGGGTAEKSGQQKGSLEKNAGADRGARVQLSEQQRTTIRERIVERGKPDRVTNVNFQIRIGERIPRRVVLHELPPDVIRIVPEYRGYRYVYVEEEIVIVNPQTYAIVAVVDSGGRASARTGRSHARLTLTPEQRRFLVTHVERRPALSLGIGDISIGVRIPGNVELRPIPELVVERIPELSDYRYFVFENEVVIVDPRSTEVVLKVEE